MQSRAPSPPRVVTVNISVPNSTVDIDSRGTQGPMRDKLAVSTKSKKYSVDDPENNWHCLSSDGVLYGIPEENARVNSDNIFDPNFSEDDDLEWHVRLNVSSEILDLLFEFLYNKPRTNLESIPFQTLTELTDAAEEYRVQSAIDSCKNALRKHIPVQSLGVLRVVGRYGYHEELIQVAPHTVDTTLPIINATLPPALHMSWCIYREQFISTHRFACESYPTDHKCQHWNDILLSFLPKLRGAPGTVLLNIEVIFQEMVEKVMQRNGLNACCIAPLNLWCEKVIARRNAHELLKP